MASILIWGRSREILAGDLPLGITTSEVRTLPELRAQLDSKGGTLVLVDPGALEAQRPDLEAWLGAGGNQQALLVGVVEAGGNADDVLGRYAFLDDILFRPVTPGRLRLRLERALDTIHSRRVITQLDQALARKSTELHELNKIGVALSAERDINKLLELILAKCREITAADAGSLYLVIRGKDQDSTTDDQLSFELTQNETVTIDFKKAKMPLSQTSIAGYVALTGETVNVADVYHLPAGAPYSGSGGAARSFDEKSGYRTKSMLVVAMKDHKDEVIGVVQLINKKRDARTLLRPLALVDETVIPFTSVDEELVSSLTSQAAVAYENTRLIADIRRLFESFVGAAVTAIEQRDPTTSGHSERVAKLTVGLAEKVDALDEGPFRDLRFTRDQLQEIRYASLLHDFGKVGVREKVLIKGKKLYVGEMHLVKQRIAYIKKTVEADYLRSKLEQLQSGKASAELLAQMDRDYESRHAEVDQILRMILQANEPTILEEESFRALMDLPNRIFTDVDGNRQPFLTPNEVQALSIRRGSLSEKERREIESHVTHTFNFLATIPWTGEFRRVPEIAYAHHEKLDGTGYPRKLKAAEIPVQSRMMTISDIFDALVAWDRPYKKSVPVERALNILGEEAGQGKLDTELLRVFVDAKIYEKTLPRAGAEAAVAPR
ncbi:MAG TPA: HD domain-containing phosphohydrolase [Vicinamibacteria bacterium]|nr:HD domain-containing phosphohydrolase [Vicinamibacteria bacterium]